MNKFKFIQSLIENKSFNEAQKEKFFMLTAKELEKASDLDDSLLRDIEIIKDKLGIELTKQESKKSNNNIPKYVNPGDTRKFLLAFNQDKILRTTCHLIDNEDTINLIVRESGADGYNFSDHLKLLHERYRSLKGNYYLDSKISSAFKVYLTGKNYKEKNTHWSETDKIRENWGSDRILNWANENKGIIPNPGLNIKRSQKNDGYTILPFNSRITGERIREFSELVLHFKHLFHIRGDNSLFKIIDQINESKDWKTAVNFNIYDERFEPSDFPENIELFIDVDNFRKAYIKIIRLAIEQSSDQDIAQIDLKLKRTNDSIFLSICHSNSKFTNRSAEDLVNRIGEAHTWIINHLNGICNLELNADFGNDQYFSVNLWNNRKVVATPLNFFTGVEHKLIFS